MGLTPIRHRSLTESRLAAWGLLVCLGLISGCASNRYYAADLPAEWQAEPTDNAQTLELTKIASPTVQTDLICPEDVLEVHISAGFGAEDNLERVARVAEDGTIFLSHLGRVHVEGLELVTAEATIASLCQQMGIYKSPEVAVTMKQPKVNKITVIGAVNEASTYELRSGASTLLDAIVAAKGLAEDAGTQVEIQHPGYRNARTAPRIAGVQEQSVTKVSHDEPALAVGPQTVTIDLISATKENHGGYYLPDGSIVHVERRDPLPIHVSGLVQKAGAFEFPLGKEMTLLDAVAEAGGVSNPLADKIFIIRTKPGHDEPILIEASLRSAKHNLGLENPKLVPGDFVSVEQTPGTAIYEALRLVGFGISGRAF